MTTSALSAPVDLLKPAVGSPLTGATGKTREQIAKTAKDFEASFVSVMLGQMFEGVGESGQFTGGEGEQMFKSFMMDAMSKQMSKAGGIGIAGPVQKEMLKLQGLEG
jgi:flagellar protein FlgJ